MSHGIQEMDDTSNILGASSGIIEDVSCTYWCLLAMASSHQYCRDDCIQTWFVSSFERLSTWTKYLLQILMIY